MEQSQDITQIIIDTINTIFENIFSSIDNNLYSLLDELTFINSDILNDKYFQDILGTSASSGILLIANVLLFAFILYYSIKFLLSHLTYDRIDKPSSFFIKMIIYAICMNSSFFVIQLFIDLMSNISLFIRSIGADLFNQSICFSSLITNINSTISVDTSSLNIFTIEGLIKSILSLSLLNLVFTYSLRYILIKVFVLITPFAFLSLILSNTSWFFKAWLKNLFSLLFIQIIVSLILLLMFSVDFSNTDLFNKFIYVGGMYGLIRANSLVRDFIGGVSTTITQSVKSFANLK